MKKLLFVFPFFYVFIGHALFDIKALDQEYGGKLLITPEEVQYHYQLLKDIHELFCLYEIPYWIQGGTLLGSLRHEGMIHWDDDADWNMPESYVSILVFLLPVLSALRYSIYFTENYGHLKICTLDIFLTRRHNDKTTYITHWWQREGQPIFVYDHELYPLKVYKYGELELYGPQSPHPYLSCGFGQNYMNEVVIYNHKSGTGENHTAAQCPLNEIPEQFRGHAKPIRPLENRVTQLLKDRPELFPPFHQ